MFDACYANYELWKLCYTSQSQDVLNFPAKIVTSCYTRQNMEWSDALVESVSWTKLPLGQRKFQIKTITSSDISQSLWLIVQSDISERMQLMVYQGALQVCSRCCELLGYSLIRWFCVYSYQWIGKDCLQTRNVKINVLVFFFRKPLYEENFPKARSECRR